VPPRNYWSAIWADHFSATDRRPALNGSGNGERQREKQKLDPAFDPNADGMSVLMARALPILTPGLGKTEP
jgi:hypothetical protein